MLATFEPSHAFAAGKVLKSWAEKVNKDSGGRLKVKVFAGGVLGKPPQQYDIVKGGVADIAWTVLGYIGGQFPLSAVVELPFMTTNAKGGTPFPFAAVSSFRLGNVTKYHAEVNIGNASFGLLMNEKKYNSLPDDLKKVIDANSGHAFGDWAAGLIDANDAKQKEVIAVLKGHEIKKVKGADLDEYKKILNPMIDEWVG